MITQLVIAILCAVLISGFCSICEAVLFSISPAQVEIMSHSGKISGRIMQSLKKDIQKPITAILTLNTIANTMGAAVAGASATVVFGDAYLGLFSAAFTLVILLFSEILPKTAGVIYHQALAPWVAIPIHWMVIILAPFTWLCQIVTRLIPGKDKETLISAAEVLAIARLSRKSGEIDFQEEKVIKNVLSLKEKTVRQAMTPRTVSFTLSEHLTLAEALEHQDQWELHSRVPLYDKDPDDIVGIALRKDVLQKVAEDFEHLKLTDVMNPVHFVPEYAPLTAVLLDFFEYHQHLFAVVDEYGGFTGVISLEDIIEEIVGREIMDESDKTMDMRELARRKRKILTGKGTE
ncbi:MAG: hemolysin family protein [Proteobacteria bacterium]|nr:hemolysin family protein [Pseudomonadota bacterium]